MIYEVIKGVSLPFLGTLMGALCVLFIRNGISAAFERMLCGFTAGVMCAASVWSLLIPSIEYRASSACSLPWRTVIGFMAGIFLFMILDVFIGRIYSQSRAQGSKSCAVLITAVTVHNLPEGMAVGIVYSAILSQSTDVSLSAAFAISLGIAIQNFPEGAIVSMPIRARGAGLACSVGYGILSGVAELFGALLTLFAANFFIGAMPYMLAFAAGAMMYVVVLDLVPEALSTERSFWGVGAFAMGFCLMMTLDTVFS